MIRLLLIDDDPDDRALARRALERDFPDLEAREVLDAAGLERALADGAFDAVVTDFQLHWSDGLTVLRKIRERYPLRPVLMFTSSGSEEIAVEAMKEGLDDYLLKSPQRYGRLPLALRAAFHRRDAEEERDRLLEREREARAAAEAASMTKDDFLATLSHELRTPLNAIVGWASLLRAGNLQGEKALRALESIERNARSQARLIDDLLDVSAIISGKMSLDVRPLDLEPVVEAALDAVRPAAEAKSIRLAFCDDQRAGPVPGDPDRLQQVVWNLLSNAVKFTPSGGRVEVSLERHGACVRLIVSDTGRGIEPSFLPHVFEPFRQADGSTTRTHGGLGLGLAIVRRLVELHDGTIHAESGGAGQGARFVVELPMTDGPEERRLAGDLGLPAAEGPAHPPLDGLRILVVDDEQDVRDLVGTLLGQAGAAVRTASSGDEALGQIELVRPDVLLCDLAMPEMDGYELIRRVRSLPPESGGRVPAAALTAYARAEDRRRTLLAGFNLHVVKPVDPEELLIVVASLAGRVG